MKLTEQQFLDGLTADQSAYFNARLIEIRTQFQEMYADAVASVSAAKDQLLASALEELQAKKDEADQLQSNVLTLTAERNSLAEQVQSLTVPQTPVADYMITPATFVERLEEASPGVIDRMWSSDTKEAGRLAVTLFTWSERIDCRPGGRLEGYLNLIVQMGFMDSEDVQKVWV